VTSTIEQCRAARAASRIFACAETEQKNQLLEEIATRLLRCSATIVQANARDMERARASGSAQPMLERLLLDEARLSRVADAVRAVAALADPVGETVSLQERPSGITVRRVRVPLGVIAMIYESRPNVTVDASALALKAGNALVLRGGSEARQTNEALTEVIQDALVSLGYPKAVVQLVATQDRSAVRELVRATEYVDLAIPRGGEALIREVVENATVPVVQHYKGVCHMVIDAGVDVDVATRIVLNAKVQRPSVCNALECLVFVASDAPRLLPAILSALNAAGCEIRGCDATRQLFPQAKAALADDYGREFLDKIIAVRVVASLSDAMDHIAQYGSGHTEAILSPSPEHVALFQRSVDAACVVANASTRFHDGGELGLGAEIGIATSRLHWRGPMGLESLTTMKWIVSGDGHIRA
jgi:glutamate-5-semialdehyde dehydrogenase